MILGEFHRAHPTMEATMRLNQNASTDTTSTTGQHSEIGFKVRELSEDEIVDRILKKTGPGSLMDDLSKMPPVPERIGKIKLR